MDKKLTFHKTLSIQDFKALNNNNGIDIIKNPTNNKLFFTCGQTLGAVSADYAEAPCASLVSGEDNEEFWLIHKKASTNVVASL